MAKPRFGLVSLAALCGVAQGCNCQPDTGEQECSSSVMTEALSQVQGALAGNTSCDAGSDCVLVQTPCGIETTCSFNFSAVNLAGQAAVEHAFSVTAAEVCPVCTPDLTDIDEPDVSVDCPNNNPGAECVKGRCTVATVPPPCLPDRVCGADEFCDISGVSVTCSGQAYYVAVTGSGACEMAKDASLGGTCQTDAECPAGESCLGANPTGFDQGSCGCPDAAERPTTCDDGCEIQSDENGCNFCYCPNGCPDGGTADGG